MIHFEGTLTLEIYRRALGVTGRSMRFFAGMWIVVGTISLRSAEAARPLTWTVPLFFIFFGVFFLLSPRITVRRAFATDRLLSEPLKGEADEQGVRIESAHGTTDLPWTLVHRIVVTPNLVTIYQSAHLLRIVPREFFADEESWQSFHRLASAVPTAAKPSWRRPLIVFLIWIGIVIVVFVAWNILSQ